MPYPRKERPVRRSRKRRKTHKPIGPSKGISKPPKLKPPKYNTGSSSGQVQTPAAQPENLRPCPVSDEEEEEGEEEEEVLPQLKDKTPDLADLVNHPEYLEWKKNLVCELCGDKGHCYSSCAVPIDVETLPIGFTFLCKCGEVADIVSKLRCRRYHGTDQRRVIKKHCLICGKWGLHWEFDCPVAREENKA